MTLKSTIEDMPTEKQVAWALRLVVTLSILAVGTISWGAFEKLDRIAETQAAQTVKLDRLVIDDASRRARIDTLTEMYYRLTDQLRALDLRISNMEQRRDPPRDSDDTVSP